MFRIALRDVSLRCHLHVEFLLAIAAAQRYVVGVAIEGPHRAWDDVVDASDNVDRLWACHAVYVNARSRWSRQRSVYVVWDFGGDGDTLVASVAAGMAGSAARCHRCFGLGARRQAKAAPNPEALLMT